MQYYPNEQFFKKPRITKVDTKRYPRHPTPWTLILWRGPNCQGIRTYATWQEAIDYLIGE